jgi:homocysteine S-methyltransferase
MSTSTTFRNFLASKNPIIIDGALATQLEAHGLSLTTRLWSAEVLLHNPALIATVHKAYFRAGADIAITASYQVSEAGFVAAGYMATEALKAVAMSVRIARTAAEEVFAQSGGRRCFVAGSVGPYGAALADGSEYRGDYSLPAEEMRAFHRPRIRVLLEEGVDVLACETVPSFAEAQALVKLLSEFPDAVAWMSFTLRDAEHISDGTLLEEVARLLDGCSQILAIGVNCVPGELVDGALRCLAARTTKPLVVYPNSGELYDAKTKTWSGSALGDDDIGKIVHQWQSLGARLIGGCCRTTPDDIRVIKDTFSYNVQRL